VAPAGYLTIEEGTFGTWSADRPAGIEVRDFSGTWVAPGYVDTHVHGFADHDVMDCDADGVNEASRALARRGTTSWVPTTLTQPAEQIEAACASVWEAAERRGDDFLGARIEGIFLEGPFFSEKRKGAQNPANMLDPSVELFCRWQEAAHGLICKSSLAPERAGATEYCRDLKAMGVVTALGHSSATCDQGLAALAAALAAVAAAFVVKTAAHHGALYLFLAGYLLVFIVKCHVSSPVFLSAAGIRGGLLLSGGIGCCCIGHPAKGHSAGLSSFIFAR
jgi:N-acetylglucosamine-6-phosphate deacetylase